jgi:hypothetical protein
VRAVYAVQDGVHGEGDEDRQHDQLAEQEQLVGPGGVLDARQAGGTDRHLVPRAVSGAGHGVGGFPRSSPSDARHDGSLAWLPSG